MQFYANECKILADILDDVAGGSRFPVRLKGDGAASATVQKRRRENGNFVMRPKFPDQRFDVLLRRFNNDR